MPCKSLEGNEVGFVYLFELALCITLDLIKPGWAVEIEVDIHVIPVEVMDANGMALARARLGLLNTELVQQPGNYMIDELRVVIGMKAENLEGELGDGGIDNLIVPLFSFSISWHTHPQAAPLERSALFSYNLSWCGAAMPIPATVNPYKHHRFPGDIISHAVWLYFRFPLSHRDVEELLFVRGVIVSYEAIRVRHEAQ